MKEEFLDLEGVQVAVVMESLEDGNRAGSASEGGGRFLPG